MFRLLAEDSMHEMHGSAGAGWPGRLCGEATEARLIRFTTIIEKRLAQ